MEKIVFRPYRVEEKTKIKYRHETREPGRLKEDFKDLMFTWAFFLKGVLQGEIKRVLEVGGDEGCSSDRSRNKWSFCG